MIHGKCPACKTPASLTVGQRKFTCESCGKVYGVRWENPQQPELLEAKRPCLNCQEPLLIPATEKSITCHKCHTPHIIQRKDKIRLEPVGTLQSPIARVSNYSFWRAGHKWAGRIGVTLLIIAGLFAFITMLAAPTPVIVLAAAGLLAMAVRRWFFKPTLDEKRRAALKEVTPDYNLSPRFQEEMVRYNVDITDTRGKQILNLYRTMGEDAATAVARERVAIGMTEGMVRLAWGTPSTIKAKHKGARIWRATNPETASQNHERMLWVYKTATKKKVWFKKGRVFRAQKGNVYTSESINPA